MTVLKKILGKTWSCAQYLAINVVLIVLMFQNIERKNPYYNINIILLVKHKALWINSQCYIRHRVKEKGLIRICRVYSNEKMFLVCYVLSNLTPTHLNYYWQYCCEAWNSPCWSLLFRPQPVVPLHPLCFLKSKGFLNLFLCVKLATLFIYTKLMKYCFRIIHLNRLPIAYIQNCFCWIKLVVRRFLFLVKRRDSKVLIIFFFIHKIVHR